jgi:hypothetical protein
MRSTRAFPAALAVAALMSLSGLDWQAGRAESATSAPQRTGSSGDAVGTRLHDGAKDFGEGLLGGIKFVGRTIISPFTGTTDRVGRDADATGKRLHRGAKGFGEGLRDGLKYTGEKIGRFFSDSSSKGDR